MKPIDEMDYDELKTLHAAVNARLETVERENRIKDKMRRIHRNIQRAIRKRELEARSREIFANLVPGDLVRITGTRNTRYPLRLVTSVDHDRFSGWQFRYNRNNNLYERGTEHTTHMSTKIREVIMQNLFPPRSVDAALQRIGRATTSRVSNLDR